MYKKPTVPVRGKENFTRPAEGQSAVAKGHVGGSGASVSSAHAVQRPIMKKVKTKKFD